MDESPNPQSYSQPTNGSPVYKRKRWIITGIAIVLIAIIGGVLIKQSLDEKSRTDAKAAAAAYEKAAPADFNKLYASVSSNAAPTDKDVTIVEEASKDRPRLKTVNGVGAELPEYKDAKQLDQKIGAFYDQALSDLRNDFLPLVQYSAAIQNFATARDQAAAAINESGGSAAAAVTIIRSKSIPIIQASLDAFKKAPAPHGAEKLTALVVKTHQDFISGFDSFAKEIESGNIQNHDFSAQIGQINTELQTLTGTIQKKNDSLKAEGAALQKELA